jgi:hypothetical protein
LAKFGGVLLTVDKIKETEKEERREKRAVEGARLEQGMVGGLAVPGAARGDGCAACPPRGGQRKGTCIAGIDIGGEARLYRGVQSTANS